MRDIVVSYPKSSSNHNLSLGLSHLQPVVSYPKSSSNHNALIWQGSIASVVSYPKSSSNHNSRRRTPLSAIVVSYPKSSSNHNLCRIKACYHPIMWCVWQIGSGMKTFLFCKCIKKTPIARVSSELFAFCVA